MANFFLIDHSLRRLGGHHFDYSRCVAEAANEAGFLTTIGVNRSIVVVIILVDQCRIVNSVRMVVRTIVVFKEPPVPAPL